MTEWTVADWYEKIEARRRLRAIEKKRELDEYLAQAKHSGEKRRRFNRRPPMGFAEASKSESLLSFGGLRDD